MCIRDRPETVRFCQLQRVRGSQEGVRDGPVLHPARGVPGHGGYTVPGLSLIHISVIEHLGGKSFLETAVEELLARVAKVVKPSVLTLLVRKNTGYLCL